MSTLCVTFMWKMENFCCDILYVFINQDLENNVKCLCERRRRKKKKLESRDSGRSEILTGCLGFMYSKSYYMSQRTMVVWDMIFTFSFSFCGKESFTLNNIYLLVVTRFYNKRFILQQRLFFFVPFLSVGFLY